MSKEKQGQVEVETQTQVAAGSFLESLITSSGREGQQQQEVADWIGTLLQSTTKVALGKRIVQAMQARVADIDRELSSLVNKVMHHEKFRRLEGSWRGLHYLINRTETGPYLRVQVLDISKEELIDDAEEGFQQAKLFKKIYTDRYNTHGGVPIAAIVGDYDWTHGATDLKGLTLMANIGAAAHCPFVTAPSPRLLGFPKGAGWNHLKKVSEKAIDDWVNAPDNVEMTAYRSFRESEDSRFVAMCMPRVIARLPYGGGDCEQKALGFDYQELEMGDDGQSKQTETDSYCWFNAAYAMGAAMTNAFFNHGWAAAIRGVESGGLVEDLPIHYYRSQHQDIRVQCPTEMPLSMSYDSILAKVGILPLIYELNSDRAVFFGGQTAQKPKLYGKSEKGNAATSNAALSARLPYMMAVSRVVHTMQPMLRQMIGSNKEAEDVHLLMNKWLVDNYVLDQSDASEAARAERPFRSASVEVRADARDPGVYHVGVQLRPHFQLEEVNVGISLVARKPEK